MDINKEFEKFVEEVEKEASTYRDKARDDEKKKKKHFSFGGKKDNVRAGGSGYGKGEEVKKEDYDKNQLIRVQHDEALIAEAGNICGLDRGDLRSKSMQSVWDKKCAPETSKKKKKSIFGKSAKGLKLYNQNLKGEDKMEKLVDTVRRVLVGEGEGDQAEYQKKRKAVAKKFGVESCSALKDEKEKKACYKALDDAHVADHEEQVELEKMNEAPKGTPKPKVEKGRGGYQVMVWSPSSKKYIPQGQPHRNEKDAEKDAKSFEEVEVKKKVTEGVDLKKLKKEYEDNEDRNNHTGNYLLLAKSFGTSSDVKKVKEIMKRNEKQGSTSKKDMDWMHKNIGPYYDKIRNEEVKVEKTMSKLFSHVRKLMSK